MSGSGPCTAEEQASFNTSQGTNTVCLTPGDSIGLTLIAESGFISLVAVLIVFILIYRNASRNGKLIRHPTDIYMLSLFSFDLIAAVSKAIYIKWIREGKVYTGHFCTVQGAVQQLGDTGSALATLAIAIYTFVTILWGPRRHHYFIAYAAVSLTWLFIVLFITISVTHNTRGSNFFDMPVGYWCWIGNRYKAEQYVGQYLWIWITMFMSFLTYTPLFFWARGNITVSTTHWWKFKVHNDSDAVPDIDPDGRKRRSINMIVYPLVFGGLALPLSIVRWGSDFGRHPMPTATFAAEFIYSLSGALNVLLFLFTRSALLLPRNRSGITLGAQLTESNTEVMDFTTNSRQRSRGHAPVPLGPLPGTDDVGWRLRPLEQD